MIWVRFMAVDHMSFSAKAGGVFGWLGPNGAGKTTIIRTHLGLIKPTSGSASMLGFDPVTQTKTMQAHVGYRSQQFTLHNELTARENIQLYGKVCGLERDELGKRQVEILRTAGLVGGEKVLSSQLSGG
ncbi:MAG: ATP-binding cassette domain-containing protein [Anaerolineales bacterium]|jgi:ABC-2 type transport system ATP-binding protein